MPIIIPANSAVSGGFDVDNSCRFNDGSSDYLTKSNSSAGSTSKSTISLWTKRSGTSSYQDIWESYNDGSNYFRFRFRDDNRLDMQSDISNSTVFLKRTTRVFRDISAWYHICVKIDLTQSNADKIKLFINGTRETTFDNSTDLTSTSQQFVGGGGSYDFTIGRHPSSDAYYDGYMAEYVFIDGQALDPTSFGEFGEDSGIWKPIKVSGLTFGTNGFYLDFEDSSALGNDAAGSNNFTVNNLTAIDQSTDTCANNFCTMNPLDNYYASTTFSEGNLKLVTPNPSGWNATNTATMGVSSGKWYWELLISTDNNVALYGIKSGVATGEANYLTETTANGDLGYGIVTTSGNMGYPDGQSESYGAAIDAGDIMMFALDMDNLKFYFGKGGTWGNSGNPAGNSNGYTITAPPSGFYFPAGANFVAETVSYNFGSPPYAISSGNTDGNGYGNFEYSVPSGYLALNTKNLSEVLS